MEFECPAAKKPKLDIDGVSNSSEPNVNDEIEQIDDDGSSLHQKLRQFDVLDEVRGDESGSDDSRGNF